MRVNQCKSGKCSAAGYWVFDSLTSPQSILHYVDNRQQAYFRLLRIRSQQYHTDLYYCSSQKPVEALYKTIMYAVEVNLITTKNNEVTTFALNFTFKT